MSAPREPIAEPTSTAELPAVGSATVDPGETAELPADLLGETLPPLERRPRSLIANAGRGFLMGAADIIPGVSGGTVALILGIYTRLIAAIGRVGPELLSDVKAGRLAVAARRLDLSLTLPLFVGILFGAATLGSVVDVLLEDHRQSTLALFFGLIAASAVFVARLVPRWTPAAWAALAVAAVAAFLLVAVPALQNPPQGAWYLLPCGMIGICAMILPGVSGAFLLLVLGVYERITGTIKRCVKFDATADDFVSLTIFAVGCLIGLLSAARIISRLLKAYPSVTLAALCGLMIGSLRKLWPFQREAADSDAEHRLYENLPLDAVAIDGDFWLAVGLAVAGAVAVFAMERIAGDDDDGLKTT